MNIVHSDTGYEYKLHGLVKGSDDITYARLRCYLTKKYLYVRSSELWKQYQAQRIDL